MQGMALAGTVLATGGLVAAVAASGHALLYKRRPQSAFGWIALCFTLPLAGAVLYYLFGINRVQMRARKLLTRHPVEVCPTEHVGAPSPGLEPLGRLGHAITHLPLTTGNAVTLLHNGEETFPAMLAAIRGARRRVFLSTYIFDTGPLGREFIAALAEAAARGVDVRVLLDGIGELYSLPRASTLLRGQGVRVAHFLPPRVWPPPYRKTSRGRGEFRGIPKGPPIRVPANRKCDSRAASTRSACRSSHARAASRAGA